ncbi:hypothetical protein ACFSQJ_01090 [Croceitalea marina]|uniref:Uncharacterized protein n=1 Tax=Croceitalea marina TaxID=1775166 RepID=A0ABW5MRU2_9FLAO
MNTLHTQKYPDLLERSRNAVLNLGYEYIVFKTKFKKTLIRLKRRILR